MDAKRRQSKARRFVASTPEEIASVYNKAGVVLVRDKVPEEALLKLDPGHTWSKLDKASQDSWCVENGKVAGPEILNKLPKQSDESSAETSWYVSFIAKTVPEDLPFKEMPIAKSHSDSIWFFVGHHASKDGKPLRGRPEHTDDVPHDGTFHIQARGSKRWFLRPTDELLAERPDSGLNANDSFEIECKRGDLIAVNTRLWWHQTELPASKEPSFSYARDFYLEENQGAEESDFINQDGFYAAANISAGTILVREDDMPDCELPTSKSDRANCEVVELDDGENALVAKRDISTGEWFVVYDSDAESDAESSAEANEDADDNGEEDNADDDADE